MAQAVATDSSQRKRLPTRDAGLKGQHDLSFGPAQREPEIVSQTVKGHCSQSKSLSGSMSPRQRALYATTNVTRKAHHQRVFLVRAPAGHGL